MSAIRLILAEGGAQRWHGALFDRLAADGHRVSVETRANVGKPPLALAMVESLERLILTRGRESACDPVVRADWGAPPHETPDLTFDLTGSADPAPGAIVVLHDGFPGDLARDAALLDNRAPRLSLASKGERGWILFAQGLPAIEKPWILDNGRNAVAARSAALIRGFAKSGGAGLNGPAASRADPLLAPLAFFSRSLIAAARRRLQRLLAHEGHWRIAWRSLTGGDSVLETLAWPQGQPWRRLSDDRRRYFADPFLFEHAGTTTVFCEEYPYATRKAVISAFTLGADGAASAPRVVLERPYHLSYPMVFRHDGQIWMMPESSANGTLELYRADPFPHRWTLDRVLIEGEAISDATTFEHADRWWMTAATNEPGTSSWDCLSLFSAPGPLGPWTKSGDGPVLIDAAAARPAGRVMRRGGALWRPAQDCTGGYGSGLSLCRIDAVSEGELRQTVMGRLGPPPGMHATGAHTLNANDRFEIIDVVGWRARFGFIEDGGPS